MVNDSRPGKRGRDLMKRQHGQGSPHKGSDKKGGEISTTGHANDRDGLGTKG